MITAHASATGWAFLVARGRHTDYRTVLAPDFLVDDRAYGILSYSVTKSDARPGETRAITVTTPHGQRLHVHYRNEVLDSGEHLVDEHGRPFEIVYGVVTRPQTVVVDTDLARAREEALESYRQFLDHEDDHGVARSGSFALAARVDPGPAEQPDPDPEPDPEPDPDPEPEPDPDPDPEPDGRRVWPIVAGAAGLVVAAAAVIAIAASSGSSPSLTVHAQSNACSRPLVASIATNGPQTVDYRWNSASGAVLEQGRLRFTGAATRQVSLPTAASGAIRLNVSVSGQTRIVTFPC